jgi:hypothetical protein
MSIGRALAVGSLGLAAIAPVPAAAQSATIREIVRVVKTARPGSTALSSAKVNQSLATGERVRTGGRSAAGIRFPDQSLLRIAELSEVVITAGKGTAELSRGRAFADYKTPGVIRSGTAVAAIRGTQIEVWYDAERKKTRIHCYRGRVFASALRNPVMAGTADTLTANTLTDDALKGSEARWVGGALRLVDGPHKGHEHRVTAFDAASGTLTFEPALPQACGQECAQQPPIAGYLVAQNPDGKTVELNDNEGTEVGDGGDPTNPHRIPHKSFSDFNRYPFFQQMFDGEQTYVYPGTPEFQDDRDENWNEWEAIRKLTEQDPDFIVVCGCGDSEHRHGRLRTLGVGDPLARSFRNGIRPTGTQMALAAHPDQGLTPEYRELPELVQPGGRFASGTGQFRVEPFLYGSDESEAYGTRVRYQAVSGNLYAEIGYRWLRVDNRNDHDVSEGFLHMRNKWGDVIAGRQHLFLGPSNNSDIGRLLSLESVDAVVYQTPPHQRYRQQVGYAFDTKAVDDRPGHHAFWARGQMRLMQGNVGYSVMELVGNRGSGKQIGWQFDLAQPVLRNVLDVYGEGGIAPSGRHVVTAGLYVPWAYHKYKLDVFAEYATREDRDERVSLRLRREMGGGLLLIGFLDQHLGSSQFTAGGGIMWSRKFR